VYVDYERGNWCEGLTTFMADYFYKEQESAQAARAMRLDWLRDFAAVVPGQDFPLREFTARSHGTSQVVGYHKAAYVFLMLRDLLGADSFDAPAAVHKLGRSAGRRAGCGTTCRGSCAVARSSRRAG
jgi:hypothetical protein